MQTAIRLNPKLALAHSLYGSDSAVRRKVTTKRYAKRSQRTATRSAFVFINVGVAGAITSLAATKTAIREARQGRAIFPGVRETGNVLTAYTRRSDKLEEAAPYRAEQLCWGSRSTVRRFPIAFREGGRTGLLANTARGAGCRDFDVPPQMIPRMRDHLHAISARNEKR